MYGSGVLKNMIDRVEKIGGTVEVLPEETNWLEINYE
jgi:signal transduction histidine kinase